jgi:hypothetical protein
VPATRLDDIDAVIHATEQYKPLIAQTVIEGAGGTSRAVLECPIAYMNFTPGGKAFQVGVGPVLFAGTAGETARGIEAIELG